MEKLTAKNIATRASAPTSPFFKKLIGIGIVAGTIGASIIAAPATMGLALPAIILTVGKGLALAGSITAMVSKLTVDPDKIKYYK